MHGSKTKDGGSSFSFEEQTAKGDVHIVSKDPRQHLSPFLNPSTEPTLTPSSPEHACGHERPPFTFSCVSIIQEHTSVKHRKQAAAEERPGEQPPVWPLHLEQHGRRPRSLHGAVLFDQRQADCLFEC